MKVFQPTTGDNNFKMNIGCMSVFILFELILLVAMVASIVSYRAEHLFLKVN